MIILVLAAVGAASGVMIGFVLVTLNFYLGNSGYTGTEHVGFRDTRLAWIIAVSGGIPLGAIITPLVYFRYLQHTPLTCKWAWLPMSAIIGGVAGSLGGLELSIICALIAFLFCASRISGGARIDPSAHDNVKPG